MENLVSADKGRCYVGTSNTTKSVQVLWHGDSVVDVLETTEGLYGALSHAPLQGPYASAEEAQNFANKSTSFRHLLLQNCQSEFHREDKAIATSLNAVDAEEQRLKIKFRMLGNIRFIGELYKKGMLRVDIMHFCILKLLAGTMEVNESCIPIQVTVEGSPDEQRLEALSKLLTTIGKQLDASCGEVLDLYCNVLQAHARDTAISTRIRFMLQDVIDLRTNGWKPRRVELQQKTLQAIRKDVENEQKSSTLVHAGGRHGNGSGAARRGRSDNRGSRPPKTRYHYRAGGNNRVGGSSTVHRKQQHQHDPRLLIRDMIYKS
ncbi:MAG: hypothetical protein SGARI_001199 [Bacillariaceae sp.]